MDEKNEKKQEVSEELNKATAELMVVEDELLDQVSGGRRSRPGGEMTPRRR